MNMLRNLVMLSSVFILFACASQPNPVTEEDPRVGQLQRRVDDLQSQIAAKDATISSLIAQEEASDEEATVTGEKISQLEAELQDMVTAEIARGDLEIIRSQNMLIVSVKDSVLFAADSPKLRPESLDLLRQLAEVFEKAPERLVRVEGNTAVAISSPAAMALYPTSWHLGAARAANVVQFLQEECGMDPLHLVASSLGEYRPRADNSTEEGKARNRRVDFVLVDPTFYEYW